MNYRHAYHAGNFADVLKHSVLFALIDALKAKSTPFCLVDTHAGSGCYALDGAEAGKTGEYKEGIARLLFPDLHQGPDAGPLPPLLRHWLDAILKLPGNEDGLRLYPGSPLQAAGALRDIDSAQLCELHPEEAARLRELFRQDRRVHVHERNGYEALKALLPPKEKRGLVLIDPPYEAQEAEYRVIEQALKARCSAGPPACMRCGIRSSCAARCSRSCAGCSTAACAARCAPNCCCGRTTRRCASTARAW